ncbi:DNA recombination protein RmuC [Pollutimonas bauzanensis]|uniref:DNA recombination protein RmuC n=1 Tax=Pollutimonas bauzanensis TaxID=658167 RepID=A0A1M5SU47_9BURK|nr:DNA recombination protein RmuC [Pollutimonas bauzanensis]SHH41503.1 DNA recombination protein RmuC [Pollutimonas bauzanensis]
MNDITPEMTGALLAIVGALLGAAIAFILSRRGLSIVREELASVQNLARQRGEQLADLRAQLEQAKNQLSIVGAEKGHIDRQLARSESTAQSLRERLDEAKAELAIKDADAQRLGLRAAQLDNELTELQAIYGEKIAGFQEMKASFEESKVQLKAEFQNLANQILEEKGRTFAQNSQSSLDALLKPFREQIDGFQKRVNQVHDETLRGNVSLGSEIKRMLEVGLKMSAEANTLATALKGDKKTTGNWGEVQLERTLQLAGLAAGDHYESQARFKDEQGNNRHPDFVIKLPDLKHMVIDSKVSLVDYDRAIAAASEAEMHAALDAHVRAVRNHIDDLSKKDYSNLVGMRSPSFVLMFMPIEPAYIEAMKHNKDLFDYGYQRNVIMVSHTTLMPILKTVANLWMVARSNQQAHELSARAGEIYNQVVVVAERLKKLGANLDTVSRQYNETVKAVAGQQGLYGKASRFNELSSKANKTMPALEPLHADFESERLELIVGTDPEAEGARAEPGTGSGQLD